MKRTLLLILTAFVIIACKSKEENAVLQVDTQKLAFEAGVGSKSVVVTSSGEWLFSVPQSASSWLTVTRSGNTLAVNAAASNQQEKRTTSITISSGTLKSVVLVEQLGLTSNLIVEKDKVEASSAEGSYTVKVTSNIAYTVTTKASWIQAEINTEGIVVKANRNDGTDRTAVIDVQIDQVTVKSITVTQKGLASEVAPVTDTKIAIKSATASEAQPSAPISLSYDGNISTSYHSRWSGATVFPVTLRYYLADNATRVDYVTLFQRSNGSNGNLKEFKVNVKSRGEEAKELVTLDFMGSGGTRNVSLGVDNPEYIEFVIASGSGSENGYVAILEIEFYKASGRDYPAVFTDKSCSKLVAGTTAAQIDVISDPLYKRIAQQLLAGQYSTEYRARTYKAVPNTNLFQNAYKIGTGMSQYQGITGMYLEAGKHFIIVGDTKGKAISVQFPNWMRQPTPGYDPDKDPVGWGLKAQSVALREGLNLVNVEYSTNAYISYFDASPETAPEIIVNFPTAQVNKFFDASIHSNSDWTKMLADAPSPIMDAVGEFIQVAYPVSFFKMYANNSGKELINNYDAMLRSHYTLLGCKRNNYFPPNKLLSRVNFNYYMFRDGNGMAYLGNNSTMNMVVNPNNVIKGDPCWGFTHESGHVLQMNQLTWIGMGEVSNNIFTMMTHKNAMGNTSRLLADGIYPKARTEVIDAKVSYLSNANFLVRLVPFWQLQLYFERNGKPEFYTDIMIELRKTPSLGSGQNSYKDMLYFTKLCCEVGKIDLTEFFEKWGFYTTVPYYVEDYGGKFTFTLPKAETDAIKAEIASKSYPKPTVDLTTLTD